MVAMQKIRDEKEITIKSQLLALIAITVLLTGVASNSIGIAFADSKVLREKAAQEIKAANKKAAAEKKAAEEKAAADKAKAIAEKKAAKKKVADAKAKAAAEEKAAKEKAAAAERAAYEKAIKGAVEKAKLGNKPRR